MRVRTYRTILFSAAAAVVIMTALVFYYYQQQPTPNESSGYSAPYRYVLKEYEEKIGVYRQGEETPFRTIDVYVSTLPSVDQTELQNGIYIQSEEKLRSLIEDYES